MCLSFIPPGLLATVPTSQSQSCNTLNHLSVQKSLKTSPPSETKWETSPSDEIIGHSQVICDEELKNGIQIHRYKSHRRDESEWQLTFRDSWVSTAACKTWGKCLVSVCIFLQTETMLQGEEEDEFYIVLYCRCAIFLYTMMLEAVCLNCNWDKSKDGHFFTHVSIK